MRSIVAFATVVLFSTSTLACDIGPQANLKLDPKDQAVLISLGTAIKAQELLKGAPAALFAEPPGMLTFNASDAKTLAQALAGLRKTTACNADGIVVKRIVEDDTPGIRFLRKIEECLADACVDNK